MSFDLIIRGGEVVDGSGLPRYRADVGVTDGRITAIGRIRERAAREIDAEGHVVTPGFIDGHTHMDAQVMWDPLGTCSSLHGVTTAVMGNCGFTLAPCRDGADGRELVVANIERAEDISAEAMAAGIDWTWSNFDGYLDAVGSRQFAINYAANIGHSALRTWAMGAAAFERAATDDELAAMETELRRALDAGAAGFTTSRSASHQTPDDRPVASRAAPWPEVQRLVGVLTDYPGRPFELALEPLAHDPDPSVRRESLGRLRDLAIDTAVPVMFGVLPTTSQRYDELLALIDETTASGGRMYGQAAPRGVSMFISFETRTPFDRLPTWQVVRALPRDAQVAELRKPDVRERLVAEAHGGTYGAGVGAELKPPNYDNTLVFDRVTPPH
ncbi:MAG TPA: amidohydrolase family protein, partial [Ilumatobacteraceae bacterium]|nr:amidohydrolase family protein [Ilumatobacteraceae bacterium]